MNWQDYIISDPKILLGKPILKGTRISVALILELYENAWTAQMIFEAYPHVTADMLRAVFAYLKDCIQQELYLPISA